MYRRLYTWNWKNGGYNGCYAVSYAEARRKAEKLGEGWDSGGVDWGTMKLETEEGAKAYWLRYFHDSALFD